MSLYDEALVEAKKLKQIAEQDAKNAIIEDITPHIRKLIVSELAGKSNPLFEEEDKTLAGPADTTGSVDAGTTAGGIVAPGTPVSDNATVVGGPMDAPIKVAGADKTKQTMERGKDGKWHSSVSSGGTPNAENSTEGKLPPKRQESGSINVKSEEKIQPPKENRLPVGNEIVVTYPPILVNEIFVGGEGENANEYIELFNPNTEAFSLTGWSIKKRSSSGGFSSLVSASRLQGKSIAPKSYFLIGNEGGYTGSPLLDAGWAKSNTLAYAQNSIVLLSPLGEQVLEVVWNEIPKGKSFSLNQEGIFQVSEKTPKAENK
jgi:hypothetical protein